MPRRAQFQQAVDDGSQSITAYYRTGPGGRGPVTGEASRYHRDRWTRLSLFRAKERVRRGEDVADQYPVLIIITWRVTISP